MAQFRKITSYLKATTHLDLTIEAEGAVLLVRKGSFSIGGQSYDLLEDEQYDLVVRPHATDVTGWLVRQKQDHEVRLLIDESEADGLDSPLLVNRLPDIDVLERLFGMTIPASASTFDDVSITVHVLAQLPENASGQISAQSQAAGPQVPAGTGGLGQAPGFPPFLPR